MKVTRLNELPQTKGKTGWPWTEETDPDLYSHLNSFPKISIVTPSFNQGAFIEETIRSVLLQNYPNIEYIIIDGGSSDNTLEIIKKYEPWIDYWISEPDDGQSQAINKGLRQSDGDIFNWLNSDDYYEPQTLFRVAEAFKAEKRNLLLSRSRIHGVNGTFESPGTFMGDNLRETFSKLRFDQPASFFRKSALDVLGELDEQLHLVMDADLWIRFLLVFGQSEVNRIDSTTVNFREHKQSKTVNGRNEIVVERAKLLSRLRESIKGKTGKYKQLLNKLTSHDLKETLKGVNSFQLYWFCHFSKIGARDFAGKIKREIDFSALSIKEKIVYLKAVFF